jgi:hypothetical protein
MLICACHHQNIPLELEVSSAPKKSLAESTTSLKSPVENRVMFSRRKNSGYWEGNQQIYTTIPYHMDSPSLGYLINCQNQRLEKYQK